MDLKAPLEYGKSPKITDEQVQRLENGTDSVNSMQSKTKRCNAKYENNPRRRFPKNSEHEQSPASKSNPRAAVQSAARAKPGARFNNSEMPKSSAIMVLVWFGRSAFLLTSLNSEGFLK